jgi:serine/threonine protein kinase
MIRRNQGDETLDEQYSTIWSRHGDGPEPSAADFLAEHPDASISECLDVLLTDQLLRWRCDRPRPVGEYLAEHPSLADDPEAILKLVQGEFLARLARGESPEPDSYIRMFPGLAEEIRLQCEVDRWLTLSSPWDPPSMATTVDCRSGHPAERAGDATDDGSGPASASPLPADSDAPLPGADFEMVRLLGSGGMGEVHEAVQKSLRKRVALKLIWREALDSPSRVRRFFAEARALARLRHPHIVGVHGIGRMADGRYFLVMDLIEDGTTLATLLRKGPVPFDRAAELVATVAEAIEHAHSRGVVHRDLKPSNVLLDAEGRPHVTDFGLAKVFDAADPDHPLTTADQILGTPHHMAPEQADPARGPITPRTDVYALGGLLYALLTGRPPVEGDSLTAILTRVVSPEPIPTPRSLRDDVPAALERICVTCLEKDAEKRLASARAVAGALRAWLANPQAEDAAAIAAGFPGPTTRSSDDPDAGRSRSGWATDRSLKDGRRTPNPGRWGPKGTRSTGSRRWMWAAGAVASTLALLLIAAPLALMQIRDEAPNAGRDASLALSPAPPPSQQKLLKLKSIKGKVLVADHAEKPASRVVAQRTVPTDQQGVARGLNRAVAARTAEAIALHEATLKRTETKLGSDHPDTLASRHELAAAYLAAGRTAEAVLAYEALLKQRESKLGRDHPTTLETRDRLARAYLAAGRSTEAERLLEDLVTITIGADKEAWRRDYEGMNIAAIQDQFETHPHQGYMHLGGSLGYVVTVRNQSPKELKIKCLVELTDGPNAQASQGERLFDNVLPLEGRGHSGTTWTFPGKISLNKDKPYETRMLKVSLEIVNPFAPAGTIKADAWKTQFKVTFSQVDVTKYMDIKDRFEPFCFNSQHDPGQRCYIVTYTRRADDPFTEPIRADRWRCQIVQRTAVAAPGWILPGGRGFEFHYYPADQAVGDYPWTGNIENEQVEGNVGQWSRKKKSQQ